VASIISEKLTPLVLGDWGLCNSTPNASFQIVVNHTRLMNENAFFAIIMLNNFPPVVYSHLFLELNFRACLPDFVLRIPGGNYGKIKKQNDTKAHSVKINKSQKCRKKGNS
jgi:hypothetical protein